MFEEEGDRETIGRSFWDMFEQVCRLPLVLPFFHQSLPRKDKISMAKPSFLFFFGTLPQALRHSGGHVQV